MRDLRAVRQALAAFAPHAAGMRSALLRQLVSPQRWSEMDSELAELTAAADWRHAEETGRVSPAEVSENIYFDKDRGRFTVQKRSPLPAYASYHNPYYVFTGI